MKHITIDYGIDLGTTNSAICRMTHGVPVILRSDTGMETMPSCVSFKKSGGVNVGSSAYSELGNARLRALKRKKDTGSNSCTEFKRYMGSDMTYSSSYVDRLWSPEELSALVLQSLCSFVTDEEVKAAVITVPAKFTVNQKDATINAARLAGIDHVELLQEPIAASMAYGLKADEKNGIWMVFDFGGGTLDVALVHVSDGIMQVFDTEGDNYLGGKNLDEAIVAEIILPELLRRYAIDVSDPLTRTLLFDALKVVAEKLKIALTYKESETICLEAGDWGDDDDGEEIELELTVTRHQLEKVIRPILQKAVDVCKTLMLRNNIPYGKLSRLILIGGPTYIPLLRKMLAEEVTQNVMTDIDPMTAVAQGAAIYASTIPIVRDAADDEMADVSLDIAYETSSVESETYITVKAPQPSPGLTVKLIRQNDGWESAPAPVGEKGALLIAELIGRTANIFRVSASVGDTEIRCFPSEITIIQGSKTGSAILPYNIGIEVFNPSNGRRVFTALSGLEKNRPLPASGIVYGLKTLSDLKPGCADDVLRIAIYQGDNNAEGKTAALFEYVADVVVTGDDLRSYVSRGDFLNVKIDVDRSEMMSVACEFPASKQVVEKKLDTSKRQPTQTLDYLKGLIVRAYTQLVNTNDSADGEVDLLIERTRQVEKELNAGGQHKQIEQHIKEILRQAEERQTDSQWVRAKNALKRAVLGLQTAAASRSGDESIRRTCESFVAQAERILTLKDVAKARFLTTQIDDYRYAICKDEIYRNFIRWVKRDFFSIKWTDRDLAERLVDEAAAILASDPDAPLSRTEGIVLQINGLIDNETATDDSPSGLKIDIPSI